MGNFADFVIYRRASHICGVKIAATVVIAQLEGHQKIRKVFAALHLHCNITRLIIAQYWAEMKYGQYKMAEN